MPVFALQKRLGLRLLLRRCGLLEVALRVGAHRRELRPQHVLIAERLAVGPRCQHATALAELADQIQTVEAGRDEQLFFFNDLGLGCEVKVVEAMINVLVQRVQISTLLWLC